MAEPVELGSEKGRREGRESEIVQRHLTKISFIFSFESVHLFKSKCL